MANTTRQAEFADIDRLIRDAERRKIQVEKDLWRLRTRKRKFLDDAEREAMASSDPAGLDHIAAAVDAVSPAPPKFDMQDFAARMCGMHAERFDGMA